MNVHFIIDISVFLGLISWCTQTGCFNKNDWFIHLLRLLRDLGSAPETDQIFAVTPVNWISRWIVQIGESSLIRTAPVRFSGTHLISLKTIWKEMCHQQQIEVMYDDLNVWFSRMGKNLNSKTCIMLPFLRELFRVVEQRFTSNDEIREDVSTVNISLLVKKLFEPVRTIEI